LFIDTSCGCFFVLFYPPFLLGYSSEVYGGDEMLGTPQRDITPDTAATYLREVTRDPT
jgi:galactose-1-phosphate uridylyltransferase